MNLLKTIHYQSTTTQFYRFAPTQSSASSSSSLLSLSLQRPRISLVSTSSRSCFALSSVSSSRASFSGNKEDGSKEEAAEGDEVVYQKTLRLVECAMFAAVTGLVYFLSNSLAIENYFGCFFSLPIVISSIRWNIAGGRKTMVATVMLLFILSGPVKALTYFLTHGLVGLAMGSLWRMGASWRLSIFLCTMVRALGLIGYVLTSSFLIRENILAVITINIHASLSYVFTAMGLNIMPSMSLIYMIFGTVLLLNSGFFVLLLHLLYSVFLTRLGMKSSLRLPAWLEKAI
ncbi:hypothetical protein EUTSA_v10008392mg [Eutrema salsugineum]|uniref:DUF2232 domain-containing protein n=1 Tax=Eutrema salsugineum TaxID=72664 RepID=V4K9B9_EUTSA|nr:uncharacterized protein LOC18992440 [Eutrema salsugineum]ESQ34255.1 hypothetical protein EUTSA_v10008392mg [Eutrema salsugineum]